jgi:anti-anti-sigma regulatory factor
MRRPGLPTGLVRGVPVITVPEKLDGSNTRLLLAAVRYWAAYGYASFVIDMSRTVVCDLSAFRTMVRIHGRAQAEGGEVRVVASGQKLSRFGRGLVGAVLPHFATVTEALAETPAVAIEPAWGLSA